LTEVDILIANDSTATADNQQPITVPPELPRGAPSGKSKSRKAVPSSDEPSDLNQLHRESGDQVNGFMLCALVSQSAKRIKVRAERVGASLPLSMITRSILNAYLLAAKEEDGPFTNAKPDLLKIRQVDEKVLQELLVRHSRDRATRNRP
jgi:hypothetical protein